jgi:hypothetical protein
MRAAGAVGRRGPRRSRAADGLYDIAVANRLVDIHGDDFIAEMLATFEWVPVVSVSKGRAA